MRNTEMGRRDLMRLAVLFEGGLAAAACLLGWVCGLPVWERIVWDVPDLALGVAAALPLLALLVVCVRVPWRPLLRIRAFVEEVVRPLFRDCTVADLALIAFLAGLGEELLFRGLLQEGLAGWLVIPRPGRSCRPRPVGGTRGRPMAPGPGRAARNVVRSHSCASPSAS